MLLPICLAYRRCCSAASTAVTACQKRKTTRESARANSATGCRSEGGRGQGLADRARTGALRINAHVRLDPDSVIADRVLQFGFLIAEMRAESRRKLSECFTERGEIFLFRRLQQGDRPRFQVLQKGMDNRMFVHQTLHNPSLPFAALHQSRKNLLILGGMMAGQALTFLTAEIAEQTIIADHFQTGNCLGDMVCLSVPRFDPHHDRVNLFNLLKMHPMNHRGLLFPVTLGICDVVDLRGFGTGFFVQNPKGHGYVASD